MVSPLATSAQRTPWLLRCTACAPLQSVIALSRHSGDFLGELRTAVALNAGVSEASVVQVSCGGAPLQDSWDVARLAQSAQVSMRLNAAQCQVAKANQR